MAILFWVKIYMNNKILYVVLLSLMFGGCGNKMEKLENVDSINLNHIEIIDLESRGILYPIDVFKIDGYYVFRNHLTKNNVFTFMSDDCTKVYNGIDKGNGPNEVSEMIFPKRYKDEVYVLDAGHKMVNRLALKGDSIEITKVFDSELVYGSSFAILDGFRVVVPTTPAFENPGMLALIDSAGKVHSLLEYPEECRVLGMDSVALSAFYCNTKVAVSPDEKHYAYGVYGETSFGFGDIVDNSFENSKTIVYKPVEIDKSSVGYIVPKRDNLMSTAKVVSSDDYAIFLYIGKPYGGPNNNDSNTLLLFSWSGKLCKKVILDMELRTIDFCEKTKILYGISLEPATCLVKYDLSELF